ncbi:hypothetical protein V8E36_004977 [Tilletia maclaganii]
MAVESSDVPAAFKHALKLTIPFPDAASAAIVRDVLAVDRQLRPKEVAVIYEAVESELVVKISATSVRQLRLSVNAALENAALVTKTMDAFGDMAAPEIVQSSNAAPPT